MESINQESKIQEWYIQSLHEQFNPFIKLWIAFNGWYNMKFPGNNSDKKKIDLCRMDDELLIYYQRSFSDPQFCEYMNKLGRELSREPLENSTRPRDRRLKLSEITEETDDGTEETHYLDNSPDAFKNYLDVVYRVRCNLFHCNKSPTSDRDKMIVECGYKTLGTIMKQIVSIFGGA